DSLAKMSARSFPARRSRSRISAARSSPPASCLSSSILFSSSTSGRSNSRVCRGSITIVRPPCYRKAPKNKDALEQSADERRGLDGGELAQAPQEVAVVLGVGRRILARPQKARRLRHRRRIDRCVVQRWRRRRVAVTVAVDVGEPRHREAQRRAAQLVV